MACNEEARMQLAARQNHIEAYLRGATSLFEAIAFLLSGRGPMLPFKRNDADALSQDWQAVGGYLRQAMSDPCSSEGLDGKE